MSELITAEQVYDALIHQVNGPSANFEKVFKAKFTQEHPTLQQGLVRHILRVALEVLAATPNPDARNKDSVEYAKLALAATKDIYLPTI